MLEDVMDSRWPHECPLDRVRSGPLQSSSWTTTQDDCRARIGMRRDGSTCARFGDKGQPAVGELTHPRARRHLMAGLLVLALTLLCIGSVFARELEFPLGGSSVCSETPPVQRANSCGIPFFSYRGRVRLPTLVADGPISISVNALVDDFVADLPVYVEIVRVADSSTCGLGAAAVIAAVVLTARGSWKCGVWETVGPINVGVARGEFYRIQLEFFDAAGSRSLSVSRVRIVEHDVTRTETTSWGEVKRLYQDE